MSRIADIQTDRGLADKDIRILREEPPLVDPLFRAIGAYVITVRKIADLFHRRGRRVSEGVPRVRRWIRRRPSARRRTTTTPPR